MTGAQSEIAVYIPDLAAGNGFAGGFLPGVQLISTPALR